MESVVLEAGMICKTIHDERDIEIIPAGTKVTLLRVNKPDIHFANGETCQAWWCSGENRTLLILSNNLTP
jgi:hypothetical protein